MGWAVLYIAFGAVALWLLSEVLLQHKARLRWRLLAFFGFLGVVAGVLMPSVPVIAVGAIAFAVGQTYVTLSFRRGFSEGWAIGGRPSVKRRRKSSRSGRAAEPKLQVSDVEEEPVKEAAEGEAAGRAGGTGGGTGGSAADAPLVEQTAQMPPIAMAEDAFPAPTPEQVPTPEAAPIPEAAPEQVPTGQFTGYDQNGYATDPAAAGYGTYDAYAGYAPQGDGTAQDPYAAGQFDYGQQQYAAYSDPYIGSAQQPSYDPYAPYAPQQNDASGYPGGYVPQAYGPDGYPVPQQQYDADTPPGGVWVPQQRGLNAPYPPPDQQQPAPSPYEQQQPAPGTGHDTGHGSGHGTGYDERYRY
ncbi:hypothetical protein AB0A77_15200 [Streptomyces varsoviensis]|uniref:hypothetical protein n=1 Tax=Streptomyces varsoviensis TaxID=67373 RepID=UPI0033FBCAC7